MDRRPMMTVPEVARLLAVSDSYVYDEIELWHLPAIRLGARKGIRIAAEDFDAYIAARRTAPALPAADPIPLARERTIRYQAPRRAGEMERIPINL